MERIGPINLRIPGPTPVSDEVREVLSWQMIDHRGGKFAEILIRVTGRLQKVFQTGHDVLLITGSGTAGLEAAVVNTLSPGDPVLAVSIGVFGDRFAEIAQAFGANVVNLNFEWGQAADPQTIAQELDRHPEVKAVLITHNETSTGITNPLGEISRVVKERGKLLLVDGVSSVGCIDLPTDEWGCDVVVAASQKGFGVPPGLAMISMSEEAWRVYTESKMPKAYFDLGQVRQYVGKGQTPFTPNISNMFALDRSLATMEEEGLGNIFERHEILARLTRVKLQGLGLELFGDPRYASNSVTAVRVPEGINASGLLALLIDRYGVELASGQGKLAEKILRIAHMGTVNETDINQAIDALGSALRSLRAN